ncbi:MAG: hypothetical protein WA813_01185, partial [Beijerinckiaceae bacterium]
MTASGGASPAGCAGSNFAEPTRGEEPIVAPVTKGSAFRHAGFHELPSWEADETLAAFEVFKAGAAAFVEGLTPLRHARRPSAALVATGKAALAAKPRDDAEARAFFEAHFLPFEIFSDASSKGPE